jgi:molybdenum cofactor sulfurtransferase
MVYVKDAMERTLEDFKRSYPEFESTLKIDDIRRTDFNRLESQRHVYLDYTGGGLYTDRQVREHSAFLHENIFGNPHSLNPSSLLMSQFIEHTRGCILEFFNAPPDEYMAIFTLNASGALKLVGESYPFEKNDQFLLTFDNHNSVNGIREYARAHGAIVNYVPLTLPDMRVDESTIDRFLDKARPGGSNLFAYPAQSNFSGVQHPLEWIEKARSKGWDVVLDAAAFAPTNRLDLQKWKADFIAVSFYKIFGFPTGVGCLIARKDSLAKLRRPWFSGGTITVASVQGNKFYLAEGEAAFEDGTLNYLAIPAVENGLKFIEETGIEIIHERVRCLTGWLLDSLPAICHSNGRQLIKLYGPTETDMRGGAVTMNFYDPDDRIIDHLLIEKFANEANISLRTGCFCNPGGGEIALEISKPELIACFSQQKQGLTFDDFRLCIDGKSSGAVRVSFGLVSNFADAFRFVQFAYGFVNKKVGSLS